MSDRSLHIAWLGAGPAARETGGVPGVATELLRGLALRGHRIDCHRPGSGHALPDRLDGVENVTFIWGTSDWRWSSWYNRTRIGAFVSGLLSRGFASVRLRRQVARRHREDPYDVVYQFSNIESLAVPASLAHSVPLVIHPETHIMGELRFMISERRLALRCQPAYTLLIAVAVMSVRSLVQRLSIRRARLLVCISGVFRDHLVRDYGFPLERTVVVPNPVQLGRFDEADLTREIGAPPTILVLGRIAVRKGVEDVVAVARTLLERGIDVRILVIGRTSLFSDYTKLLEDLPPENSEFLGAIPPAEVPAMLARSDLLLQASKYEPFGLTVGEALAAGVPVVATTEVGAIEGVDGSVLSAVRPGDVGGMVAAIAAMLDRLRARPGELRTKARAEAERLFAPDLVCEQISAALERVVEDA
jgi:glycosyltransferase involved in cell wall biosynthesis